MSTIKAEMDGTEFEVDLAKVTGLDATQYRLETGQELDLSVAMIIERGGLVVFAADLAIMRWLWVRQNVDPLVHFAVVAASVPLLPRSVDEPDQVEAGVG